VLTTNAIISMNVYGKMNNQHLRKKVSMGKITFRAATLGLMMLFSTNAFSQTKKSIPPPPPKITAKAPNKPVPPPPPPPKISEIPKPPPPPPKKKWII
jgi:hypothetical protein